LGVRLGGWSLAGMHVWNGSNWHLAEVGISSNVRFAPILLQKSKIERPRKSRESGFLDAAGRKVLWGQYEGRWSFLYETMWSLTSPRAKCISGL
jgi:hypothetical protein